MLSGVSRHKNSKEQMNYNKNLKTNINDLGLILINCCTIDVMDAEYNPILYNPTLNKKQQKQHRISQQCQLLFLLSWQSLSSLFLCKKIKVANFRSKNFTFGTSQVKKTNIGLHYYISFVFNISYNQTFHHPKQIF